MMFVRVAIVDIVVGLRAADAAEKSTLSDRYADVPAVLPQAVYDIGPAFFMLGLLALLIQFAIVTPGRRSVAALSPVLVALGFVTITANLDLLPVSAALLWLALALAARNQNTPAPAHAAPKTHAPA
ncbi:hypothetical protein GCM10022254_58630 [Actinomadura meridiana]|uniref:Uncharacterized protein n=1 Tax=Actinomadura meridiana TaxID=559626 RepID=A0ABP8CH94_9ACTN